MDVKKGLGSVSQQTIYELPTCYVDTGGSAQFVTVSDSFVLPNGEPNVYNGNYLLHSEPPTDNDQVEENINSAVKGTNSEVANKQEVVSNVETNVTEIILSKDQCQSLEEKGWVLLETNDKVFLLDTLWLHDITSNEKLIQTLKGETKNKENLEFNIDSDQAENLSCHALENERKQKTYKELETIALVIDENSITSNVENIEFVVKDIKGNEVNQIKLEKEELPLPKNYIISNDILKNEDTKEQPEKLAQDVIKLKTNFMLKDIPDKIVLGKTKHGKNLVAKITKPKANSRPLKTIEQVEVTKTDMEIESRKHLTTSPLPTNDYKYLNTKYACGRCAELFQLEGELKEHQEKHMDEGDEENNTLTIDNRNWSGILYFKDDKKGKMYTCLQCKATFTKYGNCQRHIKTHLNPKSEEASETLEIDKSSTSRLYQCKICYCTFNQASTLSKHIVSKHIKNSQNRSEGTMM